MSVKYELHDEIRFQLKGDDHFVTGLIEAFGEDHFVIHGTLVQLDSVDRYDIREKPFSNFNYQFSSNTLLIASGLLLLAEVTNQQVQDFGQNVSIHRSVWFTSMTLFVGSWLLKWLSPKYFKPGLKRKAVIIQKGP